MGHNTLEVLGSCMGYNSFELLFGRNLSMVKTNYDALWWIRTMTEATKTLENCWLRLWEFEFNNVHGIGKEHQRADILLRFKSQDEDNTTLVDEISILTVVLEVLGCVPLIKEPELETTEEPKYSFFSL